MRLFWLLQLLLVGLSCGQDDDPTLVSGSEGAASADPATSSNATTEDKPRFPSPEQVKTSISCSAAASVTPSLTTFKDIK